jgi:hypothetical protein
MSSIHIQMFTSPQAVFLRCGSATFTPVSFRGAERRNTLYSGDIRLYAIEPDCSVNLGNVTLVHYCGQNLVAVRHSAPETNCMSPIAIVVLLFFLAAC